MNKILLISKCEDICRMRLILIKENKVLILVCLCVCVCVWKPKIHK